MVMEDLIQQGSGLDIFERPVIGAPTNLKRPGNTPGWRAWFPKRSTGASRMAMASSAWGPRQMVGAPSHRRATTTARECSSASASLRGRFRRAGAVAISGVFGLHPRVQPGQPFLVVVEIVAGRLAAHEVQLCQDLLDRHALRRRAVGGRDQGRVVQVTCPG
jgi:hypothetical protein